MLERGLGQQGVHGVPQLVQHCQGLRGGQRGVQAGREPHHQGSSGYLPTTVREDLRSSHGELSCAHHFGSRTEWIQIQHPQVGRAVLCCLRWPHHEFVDRAVPYLILVGLRMHQRHVKHLHEQLLHGPEDVSKREVGDSILRHIGEEEAALLLDQELDVPGLQCTVEPGLVLDFRQPLQFPFDPRRQRIPGVPQQILHGVFFLGKMVY
mmetsp:Transcript_49849/g.108828  ORF Transcript_49849/g.108828 Transcript_49849/m.108828 type:complete len:208 (-) Transcript_49849:520-1143(-)